MTFEALMKIMKEQIADLDHVSKETLKCPFIEVFPASFVTYEEVNGKIYRVKANIEVTEAFEP